jgi:pimeloyl-ACP methyl ester carboxylesterase
VLALAALAAALPAAAPAGAETVEVGGAVRPGDRGLLRVPRVAEAGAAGSLEVPWLRLRGSGPPDAPPLFLLAGGPGNTYLDDLGDEGFEEWLAVLLERGDVVLLEQRGAATTPAPLPCPLRIDLRPAESLSAETYRTAIARHFRNCADRYRAQGRDLRGYDIVEMARDVHRLREHLGYDRINVMGGSFGSQLGFAVMREAPEHVHRAVLYGVEGPGDTLDSPAHVDAHLRRIADAVAANWQVRLLLGDFRAALAARLDALAQPPLRGELTLDGESVHVAVNDFDLKVMLWSRQGLKGYRDGIRDVVRLLMALELGIHGPLLEAKAALVRQLASPPGLPLSLMTMLVDCRSLRPEAAVVSADARGYVLGPEIVDSEVLATCDALDRDPLPAKHLRHQAVNVPVALVSGGLDGFTPPPYAEAAARVLPGARLVRVPLGDHDGWAALGSDPAIRRATVAFLAGDAPAEALPALIELPPLRVELLPTPAIAGAVVLLTLLPAGLLWQRKRRAGRSPGPAPSQRGAAP